MQVVYVQTSVCHSSNSTKKKLQISVELLGSKIILVWEEFLLLFLEADNDYKQSFKYQ